MLGEKEKMDKRKTATEIAIEEQSGRIIEGAIELSKLIEPGKLNWEHLFTFQKKVEKYITERDGFQQFDPEWLPSNDDIDTKLGIIIDLLAQIRDKK